MTELADFNISCQQLADTLPPTTYRLLDVREQVEWDRGHIRDAEFFPLSTFAATLPELDRQGSYVLYCKMGGRSMQALRLMYAAGFRNLKNLQGGIVAYSNTIDATINV